MKRHNIPLAIGWICCWPALLLFTLGNARADSDTVPLVIKFDAEAGVEELAQVALHADKGDVPRALVYVQGKLAGSIPGEFRLPKTKEAVAVEIGIPQLWTTPIYSFTIRPSEMGQEKVDLVNSNFDFSRKNGSNAWDKVFLGPNTRHPIEIGKAMTNYNIALPSKPYLDLAKFWLESGIKPYGPEWIDDIPPENNASLKDKVDHLVFDSVNQKVTALNASTNKTWSADRATFLPFPTAQQVWWVRSIPENAEVYTDAGLEGKTDIQKSMTVTSSFFIVVKLAGFSDCSNQTGDVTEKDGVKILTCKFN
jgi:hypothetical protein